MKACNIFGYPFFGCIEVSLEGLDGYIRLYG